VRHAFGIGRKEQISNAREGGAVEIAGRLSADKDLRSRRPVRGQAPRVLVAEGQCPGW